MRRRLPPGSAAYRRTPTFTETTVPAGLRHRHQTKPDVWGLIVVLEGQLRFRRLDPFFEATIDPACPAVIEPEEAHEVEPVGAVRFYVEFYRAVASNPPPPV